MPFASNAQRRKLYATNPKLAREFAAKTPKGKKLPERLTRKKAQHDMGIYLQHLATQLPLEKRSSLYIASQQVIDGTPLLPALQRALPNYTSEYREKLAVALVKALADKYAAAEQGNLSPAPTGEHPKDYKLLPANKRTIDPQEAALRGKAANLSPSMTGMYGDTPLNPIRTTTPQRDSSMFNPTTGAPSQPQPPGQRLGMSTFGQAPGISPNPAALGAEQPGMQPGMQPQPGQMTPGMNMQPGQSTPGMPQPGQQQQPQSAETLAGQAAPGSSGAESLSASPLSAGQTLPQHTPKAANHKLRNRYRSMGQAAFKSAFFGMLPPGDGQVPQQPMPQGYQPIDESLMALYQQQYGQPDSPGFSEPEPGLDPRLAQTAAMEPGQVSRNSFAAPPQPEVGQPQGGGQGDPGNPLFQFGQQLGQLWGGAGMGSMEDEMNASNLMQADTQSASHEQQGGNSTDIGTNSPDPNQSYYDSPELMNALNSINGAMGGGGQGDPQQDGMMRGMDGNVNTQAPEQPGMMRGMDGGFGGMSGGVDPYQLGQQAYQSQAAPPVAPPPPSAPAPPQAQQPPSWMTNPASGQQYTDPMAIRNMQLKALELKRQGIEPSQANTNPQNYEIGVRKGIVPDLHHSALGAPTSSPVPLTQQPGFSQPQGAQQPPRAAQAPVPQPQPQQRPMQKQPASLPTFAGPGGKQLPIHSAPAGGFVGKKSPTPLS